MESFYTLGFDIGTDSLGWAAISHDLKVIRKGGKRLWGVVLFDGGKSAKSRRLFRIARRRFERRRERIELLRALTAKSVGAADEEFFRRLDMSFLLNESKDAKSGRTHRFNLFNGSFTDKDYYRKYPTIYHLRHALCVDTEKADIRLVYLALHHIIKYPGNFLREETTIEANEGISAEVLDDLFTSLEAVNGEFARPTDAEAYAAEACKKIRRKERAEALAAMSGKNVPAKQLALLITGLSCELSKLFGREIDDKLKVSFTGKFEESIPELESKLGAEELDVLYAAHDVYLRCLLADILDGHSRVCDAMMEKFDKHKSDLAELKALLRRDGNRETYDKVFKSRRSAPVKLANYAAYVRTSTARTHYVEGCTREAFYKFIGSVLADLPESEEKSKILDSIACEDFMPRLNDVTNGAIPYQLHLNELKAILDAQSKYYPELAENRDKIISLLTFRRPYFVGPLKGPHSWVKDRFEGRMYPWNFTEMLGDKLDDINAEFIARMVSRDAYTGDETLPLCSITYQRYMVLNELNNLQYKGRPLPVKMKQRIFDELVIGKGSTSIKAMERFIRDNIDPSCESGDVTGYADKLHAGLTSSMKTYREFRGAFGDAFSDRDIPTYDRIVKILTVFTDKASRRRMLKKIPGCDDRTINALLRKNYSGWGKYSASLLTGMLSVEREPRDLLTLLYETDKNLNALLFDEKLGFAPRTVAKPREKKQFSYEELIEPLYASPAVKKSVWQVAKVAEEVTRILGMPPRRIFIESTRTEEKKKQKDSRLDQLKRIYKGIKPGSDYYNARAEKCLYELTDKKEIDRERVYLYFLQMGKCMYTGAPLDLDKLGDYEVDHILPRSYIVDNSLENKALVIREKNQRKSDLSLSSDVINKQRGFWEFLHSHGLMGDKKLKNLCRTSFDESDVRTFINRQLTETSQANKAAMSVLRDMYPELTEHNNIRAVRAGLSSQLRNMMTDTDPVKYGNFFKLRELNDYHHAKDAYLAAVLGTFTTDNPGLMQTDVSLQAKSLIRNGDERAVRELVNKRYGIVIDAFRSGDFPDVVDRDGVVVSSETAYNNMLNEMDRNDIMVVRRKEFDGDVAFYDQTIYGFGSNKQDLIPRKYVTAADGSRVPLDPKLYGGFSSEKQAYYVSVAYPGKKGTEYAFVGIPVRIARSYANGNKNAVNDYVAGLYKDGEIVGAPVRKHQLMIMEGQAVYVVSSTEVSNAVQLTVDRRFHEMLYHIAHGNIEALSKMKDFHAVAHDFVLEYLDKLERFFPMYMSKGKRVKEFIEGACGGFDALSVKDKCEYIKVLLIMTKSKSSMSDMPVKWNGGTSWGRLYNKNIKPDKTEWIDTSVTGYYKVTKKGVK